MIHHCMFIGAFLTREDGKVTVASSVSTFITTSIVFFIYGYLCQHYCQKQTQTAPIPVTNRTPVYKNVIPEQNKEQDLELNENIAYGPIMIVSDHHKNLIHSQFSRHINIGY